MINFTSAELSTLIIGFLWPLTRILGLVATAPVFGNVSVPVTVKIGLGVLLAMIIAPTLPALPALDPLSLAGAVILAQQLLIGVAMGFVMQVVFASMSMAGELAGLTMGLGFATFFDPQSQGRSIAISQFLNLVAILLFLALDVHLALLAALADSFTTMPITDMHTPGQLFQQLTLWGGKVFSSGIQLALPIVAALLLTNVGLAILARSAPQLNLFGIGFPITLTVGFMMLAVTVPYLGAPLARLFQDGLDMTHLIATPSMHR
ncbi:MAG: flagellar biosynthetic protein FliR [Burkholderiaceae bacterium]